jgi:hypothetical protein
MAPHRMLEKHTTTMQMDSALTNISFLHTKHLTQRWISKDVEGASHGFFQGNSAYFPDGTEEIQTHTDQSKSSDFRETRESSTFKIRSSSNL